MRWPRWFPYPVNWLRSGLALFFVVVVTYTLLILGFYGAVGTNITNHIAPVVIGVVLGLLLPTFFLAVVHKSLFLRHLPGWFPRWSSWYEGAIITVGSLLTLLVMMPFTRFAREMRLILAIGLVYGAFFFQVEYLIRQAIGNRRKPKTSSPLQPSRQPTEALPQATESPKKLQSNSILSELERLKRELGNR